MEQEQEKVVLVQEGAYWAEIQAFAGNAVVQVFSQIGKFNWIEPYNVTEQYENRGTGFFINDRGYIITNFHVIDQAKHIWVHVPILGRQPLRADIVGVCPERDLALLKLIDADVQRVRAELKAVPFLAPGDSDQIKRTDTVLALGYPLGQYRLKSSTGIVSGYESFNGRALIQTTAPINPGSSGGPLLNVRGQVVGIIVAHADPSSNVGYAIPANELMLVLDDMYTTRLVRKPLLGIRFSFANDELAQHLGNPLPAGIHVTAVFKNFLFDKAGVKPGDMLYEFNGARIDAYGDATVPWSSEKTTLSDLVARTKVGDTIQALFYRRGERIAVEVPFEGEHLNPVRYKYPDYERVEYELLGGLVIMELADNHFPLLGPIAPKLFEYTDFEDKVASALVVTHVLPGSCAHQVHTIAPGDIIIELNDQPVTTLADFRAALHKSVETSFVVLRTKRGALAALNLRTLLDDEPRLSKAFSYPISKEVARLMQALGGS